MSIEVPNNPLIARLNIALGELPQLLDDPAKWGTLVINRRKPHTFRAFMVMPDGYRVCLHRFDPCEESDAFLHPHPWPSAMIVLRGAYRMKIGASASLEKGSKPIIVLDEVLGSGSMYSMAEPLGWHSVQPLTTCWSVMVNGQPWGAGTAHDAAPTTKGKDLDKMSFEDLEMHLDKFKLLLSMPTN